MPQLPFAYEPITQRVADRVFGTTVLCQIATWDCLNVRVEAGALWLEVGFAVAYHAVLPNGTPGAELPTGKGLAPWHQMLYANNQCAVYLNPAWTPTAAQPQDPRNGEILYYHAITAAGAGWERRNPDGTSTPLAGGLAAAPEPLLRQGDAFALQMKSPLGLDQLIRYHLDAANKPPYSKFA